MFLINQTYFTGEIKKKVSGCIFQNYRPYQIIQLLKVQLSRNWTNILHTYKVTQLKIFYLGDIESQPYLNMLLKTKREISFKMTELEQFYHFLLMMLYNICCIQIVVLLRLINLNEIFFTLDIKVLY